MKRRLAAVLAVLALSVAMVIPAYAGTWKYEEGSGQWKYQRGANKFAYNEWVQHEGSWYYLDNSGYMLTGWQLIDGSWYYMDEAGVRQSGWLKNGESWYFLYPNGIMATNTVIEGRQIGEDGAWIPAEGQLEPTNTMDLSTPYLVQNLEGISTNGYTIITSGKISTGDRYANAIRLTGKGSYVKYTSDGSFRLLSGTFAPSSQFNSAIMAQVTVYGDEDAVLYASPDIHYNEKPITFGVDVTGQTEIRVEISLTKDNSWDSPVILFDGLALYK